MAVMQKSSLFDDLFFEDVKQATHQEVKKQLSKAGKLRTSKNGVISEIPISEKLKRIEKAVYEVLGRYKGFVKCVRTEEEYFSYVDKAVGVGYLNIDTETNNSLDPLTCKIMGLCLYMPNTRPVYVPINHTKVGTDILLDNQISEETARKGLEKIADSETKCIYHNGKFDLRVIYNTLGLYMPIWWDTMIASQLLDENEKAGLKRQYHIHINPTVDTYNIEALFEGIPYAWVDPEVFALYSAIDSYDTYKLQQYQQKVFEEEGMERLYSLFRNIEMPIVTVTAKMEDYGIVVDTEILDKLNDKYKKNASFYLDRLNAMLEPYRKDVEYYQSIRKLDTPINFDSTDQLNVVLYDILKSKQSDEFGRSTKKEALVSLNSEFTNTVLQYRHYNKIVTSFTGTMKEWISPKDCRLHAKFNQMGEEEKNVRTGRFSSKEPNLQQVSSHDFTLRMTFKASEGCCIVGSDFSAQEPRLLAHMANEEKLKETFEKGRDPYATISQFVFHKDYWECMETHEDGTPNPEGKKLRKKAKNLMLGITYGMGARHMSDIMGIDIDECKEILNEFAKMFPALKEFTAYNEKTAKERGYVEDYMGRRRHLPDAMKEELEVRAKKQVIPDANVFFDCDNKDSLLKVPDEDAIRMWTEKYHEFMNSGRWSAKKEFKELAKKNDIDLFDNGAFISKTLTQCTNSRIQGSASTLTKKAMVAIDNDPLMKQYGFRLMIPVHDELLGECPIENREAVEKRLTELMINSALPECSVKMKCDAYVVKHWYEDEASNEIHKMYNEKIAKGAESETAIKSICDEFPELKEETIRKMCDGTFDVLSEDI